MSIKKKVQMIGGLGLIASSLIGIILGSEIKERVLRIVVLVLAALGLTVGVYLFALGVDDKAIGMVGSYTLDSPEAQPLSYASLDAFKQGLENTFKTQPEVRRLHFKCMDGSESFTVYNTAAGIYGAPEKSVTCKNGEQLLMIEGK